MYTLLYFVIHSLIHSLIRSHLLTWPILVTLNSVSCHLRLYRLRSEVLLLLLPTLNSATWQHQAVLPLVSQRTPTFIEVLWCITAPLPFREHPCHSGWLVTMHSLRAFTRRSPCTIYSSGDNTLTHTKNSAHRWLSLAFKTMLLPKPSSNCCLDPPHASYTIRNVAKEDIPSCC